MKKQRIAAWYGVVLVLIASLALFGCGSGGGSISLSAPKAITAFSFTSPAATGTIDENAKTIAVTVPYGTNVTALIATFTTTGASVTVGGAEQVSGTTPNDFTGPVAYTVTAADSTTATYAVTVTVAATPSAVVHVTANITTPTTWTNSNTYVIDNSIVISATLTIEPGTIIKFTADTMLTTGTNGSIIADGQTAATPIIFTAYTDDAHGGDTNLDANVSTPAAGYWARISLGADGSTFNYCQFYYGGKSNVSTLDLNARKATVTNNIFAHNGDTDMINAAPALDASDALAATVVTGNTFYDNYVPVVINSTFSMDDSNMFDNSIAAPANPQPNKYNAITFDGCAHVATAISWTATKVPFLIGNPVTSCNAVYIDASGSLTLGKDVAVKFFPLGRINASGTVIADAGTGKIVLTSVKDDAHGGDTNGDGTVTTPAAGSWQGIDLYASGSTFQKCEFYYGGQNDTSVLDLKTKSAAVANNIFAHNGDTDKINASAALDAGQALAATVITGNTFYDNYVPLRINNTFSIDDSNMFDNIVSAPTNSQPNKYNLINVNGCVQIATSISWTATKVPFVIGDPITSCNLGTISASGALTLGNDVILKFFPLGRIIVYGVLNQGTNNWFTSVKDDTRGGDTNANGATTTAAKGDWTGIYYYPAPAPSPMPAPDDEYADWSNILYATKTTHTP